MSEWKTREDAIAMAKKAQEKNGEIIKYRVLKVTALTEKEIEAKRTRKTIWVEK